MLHSASAIFIVVLSDPFIYFFLSFSLPLLQRLQKTPRVFITCIGGYKDLRFQLLLPQLWAFRGKKSLAFSLVELYQLDPSTLVTVTVHACIWWCLHSSCFHQPWCLLNDIFGVKSNFLSKELHQIYFTWNIY